METPLCGLNKQSAVDSIALCLFKPQMLTLQQVAFGAHLLKPPSCRKILGLALFMLKLRVRTTRMWDLMPFAFCPNALILL